MTEGGWGGERARFRFDMCRCQGSGHAFHTVTANTPTAAAHARSLEGQNRGGHRLKFDEEKCAYDEVCL